MTKVNRREFVQATTVAGVAAASRPLFGQAPTMMTPKTLKPVVVASANGNKFKNGGSKTCVETAFAMITGGAGGLAALLARGNNLQPDPTPDSRRHGGPPNTEGGGPPATRCA